MRIKIGESQQNANTVDIMDVILGKQDLNNRMVHLENSEERYIDNINTDKCAEIAKALQNIKNELLAEGINTDTKYNNQLKTLMYLYGKFQKEVKYANPYITTGKWNPPLLSLTGDNENIMNPYGFLVKKYATCSGMAKGMAVVCKYLGIDCHVVLSNYGSINHATNIAYINDKPIHFDLASEVGMSYDGLYESKNQKRIVPKEKIDVTYKCFGRTKSEINRAGYQFCQDNTPEGIKIPDDIKGRFTAAFNTRHTSRLSIHAFSSLDSSLKELRSHIKIHPNFDDDDDTQR